MNKIEIWSLDFNKLICTINDIERITYSANIVSVIKDGGEFFKFNIVKYNYLFDELISVEKEK